MLAIVEVFKYSLDGARELRKKKYHTNIIKLLYGTINPMYLNLLYGTINPMYLNLLYGSINTMYLNFFPTLD